MMMRSSRVREETPQPTMRVTDGTSVLSMICREETRPNMPLRVDYKHTQTHSHRGASGAELHTGTHAPTKPLGVHCYPK